MRNCERQRWKAVARGVPRFRVLIARSGKGKSSGNDAFLLGADTKSNFTDERPPRAINRNLSSLISARLEI